MGNRYVLSLFGGLHLRLSSGLHPLDRRSFFRVPSLSLCRLQGDSSGEDHSILTRSFGLQDLPNIFRVERSPLHLPLCAGRFVQSFFFFARLPRSPGDSVEFPSALTRPSFSVLSQCNERLNNLDSL